MKLLGLISGTSHDGIDGAVVDFRVDAGILTARVLAEATVSYSPALRARLRAALPPAATTFAEMCALDTEIGQEFAAVAATLAEQTGGVDAVCSHGQTVYHWVDEGLVRGTLQIGQPAWIAEKLDVPVVSDVRIRDITVGGQGAPLVSYLDALLLGGRDECAAALNLGGIANITVVGDGIRAYDTGPANALIDAVIAEQGLHAAGYDEGGRIAASGVVDEALLTRLLADPYYAAPAPKSTGKELFHGDYVRDQLEGDIAPADLVRTLVELTARTVADAVTAEGVRYLAVSGGGCHNPVMMQALRDALPGVEVVLSDELGAPVDSKEAILFALIGWCTLHGIPAVLPEVTGAAAARVLGAITPGSAGLRMPEPVAGISGLRFA